MKKTLFLLIMIAHAVLVSGQDDNSTITVMIAPSFEWCERNGAFNALEVNGEVRTDPDYVKAYSSDLEINQTPISLGKVSTKVLELFKSKEVEGFKFTNLQQSLRNIATNDAFDENLDGSITGYTSGVEESFNDKLFGSVTHDYRIDIDYQKVEEGMNGSYYILNLNVINPFTAEPIAEAVERSDVQGGLGNALDMIEQAVNKVMFKVIETIRDYNSDAIQNGLSYRFEAKVLKESGDPFTLRDKCSSIPLRFDELITQYLESIAQNGNISPSRGGITELTFNTVRVPMMMESEKYNFVKKQMEVTKARATPQEFAKKVATFLEENCSNCKTQQVNKGLVSYIAISPK